MTTKPYNVDLDGTTLRGDTYTWLTAVTSPFHAPETIFQPRVPDPRNRDRTKTFRLEARFRVPVQADGTLDIKLANNPLNCEGCPIFISSIVTQALTPSTLPAHGYCANTMARYGYILEGLDPNFFSRLTTLDDAANENRTVAGGLKVWLQPPGGSAAPGPIGMLQGFQLNAVEANRYTPILRSDHPPPGAPYQWATNYLQGAPQGWPQLLKNVDAHNPNHITKFIDRYWMPFVRPTTLHVKESDEGMTARFQDIEEYQFCPNYRTLMLLDQEEAWPLSQNNAIHETNSAATVNNKYLNLKWNGSDNSAALPYFGDDFPKVGTVVQQKAGIPIEDYNGTILTETGAFPEAMVMDKTWNNGYDLLIRLEGAQAGSTAIIQVVYHIEYVPDPARSSIDMTASPVDPDFDKIRQMTDNEAMFPIFVKGHSFWKKVSELARKVGMAAALVGRIAAAIL